MKKYLTTTQAWLILTTGYMYMPPPKQVFIAKTLTVWMPYLGELPSADIYLIAMKHSKSLQYSTFHNWSVSEKEVTNVVKANLSRLSDYRELNRFIQVAPKWSLQHHGCTIFTHFFYIVWVATKIMRSKCHLNHFFLDLFTWFLNNVVSDQQIERITLLCQSVPFEIQINKIASSFCSGLFNKLQHLSGETNLTSH